MRHHQRGSGSAAVLRLAALAALLLAAACSKDKAIDLPAKLTPLPHPSLRVEHVWSATVDSKKAVALRLGAGLSIANNRVYAAGSHGDVLAIDLATGRTAWHVKTKAPLSGGTAASADLVVVGSSEGVVFALNAADGQLRWKTRVNGELLAPAAISPKLIAVRAVDGKLHGLSAEDGRELWVQEQQVPRLSLRGTSHPVIIGDVVLCGFDNGKVMAVSAGDGTVQWEAQVTPPHGRTELERLVDIDSAVAVSGHDVYAVGFQGKVAMLALDTGQVWWAHDTSSYRGLILDDDTLYVSDADGQIVAMKARTGAEVWRQPVLLHRGLSGLALTNDSIVVADFQGYVHFIDKASGALAARVRSGSVRISNPPVVSGNMVVVINDRGQINAFRMTPIAGVTATASKPVAEKPPPAAAPAPAPESK